MKFALFLFIALIAIGCNKRKEEAVVTFSQASYRVIVTMNWASPALSVPAGAHFTDLAGMVHNRDTFLWRPAGLATPGLENVAETGNTTKINTEIDAVILTHNALSKFIISPPAVTGSAETNLTFNTDYPCISFASMIAPSPDWFMGLNDFTLFNDNEWVNDIIVDLLAYDAGTENGDVFGYDNPETIPRQNIELLTAGSASVLANGNSSVTPIGSIRFIKN